MAQRFIRTFAFLALFLPAPAAASEPARVLEEVDKLFADFARENHVPGLVYGIVADGRLVHVRGLGVQDLETKAPVTPDSVFRIASLTKSFTALSVLRLRDEARLQLDEPISKYVPELKLAPPSGTTTRPIRIADLLRHSAGFVTDDPWGDRQLAMTEQAFTELIGHGIPLARAPGVFDYSNYGYTLLGRIVTRTAGEPYQRFIDRSILHPLGMTATRWDVADVPSVVRVTGYRWEDGRHLKEQVLGDGAFGAMAGLHSSARDYAGYVAWLLSAWSAPSAVSTIVSPASVREAGTGAIHVRTAFQSRDGREPCAASWMHGYGFFVVEDCEGETMLRHPGGLPGYGSQVVLLPKSGIGVFAFGNLTYAPVYNPAVAAAERLKTSDFAVVPQPRSPSEDVLKAVGVAMTIYRAGDVGAGTAMFADNLLLDHGKASCNAALAARKTALGDCADPETVETPHALAARFETHCTRGRLRVSILLAPTRPAAIQYLDYESIQPSQTDGGAN